MQTTMESQKSKPSKILDEIEALKAQKKEIEARISSLENQLRETAIADQTPCNGICPSISTVTSKLSKHGLPSDAIYRYSRHLLFPCFGVQGSNFMFNKYVY